MNGKDPLTGCVGMIVYAVISLVLAVFGFIIWTIAKWIHDNPETAWKIAVVAFLIVTTPVWLPPIIISMLVMFLCRDLVVFMWSDQASMSSEKAAVLIWLFAVPAVMLITWVIFWVWYPIWYMTPWLVFWMVAPPVIALIAYYLHYFLRPPMKNKVAHPMWPRFVAAEEDMKFDIRAWLITRQGRFLLWWHQFKKQVIASTVSATTKRS